MSDFYKTIGDMVRAWQNGEYKKPIPVEKPSRDTRKIAFNIADFLEFLEKQGCDCCWSGRRYIKDGNLMEDWESNINRVITKHTDILLEGEIL